MEATESQNILVVLATYIGPSLIALFTVWLQHRKNKADLAAAWAEAERVKAEAEKIKKEGASTEGDIFLKWTLEFKNRLEAVEKKNNEFAEIIQKQGETIDHQNDRIAEQDKTIANQNVLLIDANARIIVLEKENGDLRLKIAELELENKKLKGGC